MKIQKINQVSGESSTNFKSAIPVFIYTVRKGESLSKATPITNKETITGYCNQLTMYLNNSLKTGKNPQRDDFIKSLRKLFGAWVDDFCNNKGIVDYTSKVTAFTCVDGGRKDSRVFPLVYLTTGNTRREILDLTDKYKKIAKESGGYKTAEMASMDQQYPIQGKSIIARGFEKLKRFNGNYMAFHVYFQDNYTKTGKLINHSFANCQFRPTDKNPSITLQKK